MTLSANTMAPDFSLQDETNTLRRLSDFRGRSVILYFYPKDDTPGCTAEACNFRDDYSAFMDSDVVILGVSPDSAQSHKKFKEKYSLPFHLLSDDGHKICSLYGAWGIKKIYGKEHEGVLRSTFIIGKTGKIVKVFENVKPAEHSSEVLAALEIR
jgi:thioredoxin-dependent peroxiredoxin